MITICGFHGLVTDELAAKMDKIATPKIPLQEWEFIGSVADFTNKWDEKFLVYPTMDKKDHIIYITQYRTFGPR